MKRLVKKKSGTRATKPRKETSVDVATDVVIVPEVEVIPAESDDLGPGGVVARQLGVEGADDLDDEATIVDVSAEEFPSATDEDDEPAPRESSRSSALVPYSPLDAYLSEIRRFKPLSREVEHEVAVSYQQTKSPEAAYRLVSSNLWLVVKLARDYERVARNLLDLIQEGNIGLMEAVRNFDPYRGVRFPSYAVWWVRAYIIRYIIANWRLVKIGTTQAQRKLFFNLKKESERLEREGIFPSSRLLAE